MKTGKMGISVVCAALALMGVGAAGDTVVPAFPGAEGFGANTPGGRGGRVLLVTNLDDYVPGKAEAVPGSLRAAVETSGPRIIVFRVAGMIALEAPLTIAEPYVTIAGQSAPGLGVCLKDYACVVSDTHDVVIRYLRCRPGDLEEVEQDALSVGGSRRVVIDHCSTSWGTDETLSVSGAGQTEITVQWCLISESLDQSVHHKGAHGYGTLLRTDGNVTFHHNLYAHHRTRCPRPGTYGEAPGLLLDFRNNVVYNWGSVAGYSAEDAVRMDYVANYLKPGPNSANRAYAFQVGGVATRLFVSGNVVEGVADAGDNWALIKNGADVHKADAPFRVAAVRSTSAVEAYGAVLEHAGAVLPARDAVDARVVDHIRHGAGGLINSQSDVGGWPEYPAAESPPDTDCDGMPDAWERAQGLDPNDGTDADGDADGDGYTNVEEFLDAGVRP